MTRLEHTLHVCRQTSMIADPKSEKTLARIASALETSFVFKGIEPSVLQQVGSSLDHLQIIWPAKA